MLFILLISNVHPSISMNIMSNINLNLLNLKLNLNFYNITNIITKKKRPFQQYKMILILCAINKYIYIYRFVNFLYIIFNVTYNLIQLYT